MERVTRLNRAIVGRGTVGTAYLGRAKIDGKSKQVVYKIFGPPYFRSPVVDEIDPNFVLNSQATKIHKRHYDYVLNALHSLRGKYD